MPNDKFGGPRVGAGRNDRDQMTIASTSMTSKNVTSTKINEGTKLPLLANSKSPPTSNETETKSLFKAKSRFNSAIDVVAESQVAIRSTKHQT